MFALKGRSGRAFYRWLVGNWLSLFPHLPDRTRLFRAFAAHQAWIDYFLAAPTVLGAADTYGIELLHPVREGRSLKQLGKKGYSNHRWIVGGKLCLVLNQQGRICAGDCRTANVHDTSFQPLVRQFEQRMIVLTDQGFHAKTGDPENLKICPRGTWNDRMRIETVLSMLTRVCDFKHQAHRVWNFFRSQLGWTMALFNLLVDWNGLQIDEQGYLKQSLAEFSL